MCRARYRDSFLPLALTAPPAGLRSIDLGRVVMSVSASRKGKRLLSRLNLHHKRVRRKNPEAEDYQQRKASRKDLYHVDGHEP